MGILYITEFANIGFTGLGSPTQIAAQPVNAEQSITFTTHVESTAFKNNTQIVRLHNDATSPVSVAFGTAPVATTANMRMAANQTEYFTVPTGQGYKVSAL